MLSMRPVRPTDLPAVQRLLEEDPGYAVRVDGHPPRPDAAAALLAGRPPGVDADDKVLLGAFLDEELVAVADVVRGWPARGVALVGLLQVRASQQGRGLGRRVHDLLLDAVREWPEVTALRAAIVRTNAAHAEPFWRALGYTTDGEARPYRAGDVDTTVSVWTRPVDPRQDSSGSSATATNSSER